jgi:hypothetical protein
LDELWWSSMWNKVIWLDTGTLNKDVHSGASAHSMHTLPTWTQIYWNIHAGAGFTYPSWTWGSKEYHVEHADWFFWLCRNAPLECGVCFPLQGGRQPARLPRGGIVWYSLQNELASEEILHWGWESTDGPIGWGWRGRGLILGNEICRIDTRYVGKCKDMLIDI